MLLAKDTCTMVPFCAKHYIQITFKPLIHPAAAPLLKYLATNTRIETFELTTNTRIETFELATNIRIETFELIILSCPRLFIS